MPILNKEEGQLGTLKERMNYVIHCVEEPNVKIPTELRHAIYDLETIVKYLPDDWKFDNTGRKVEKV